MLDEISKNRMIDLITKSHRKEVDELGGEEGFLYPLNQGIIEGNEDIGYRLNQRLLDVYIRLNSEGIAEKELKELGVGSGLVVYTILTYVDYLSIRGLMEFLQIEKKELIKTITDTELYTVWSCTRHFIESIFSGYKGK